MSMSVLPPPVKTAMGGEDLCENCGAVLWEHGRIPRYSEHGLRVCSDQCVAEADLLYELTDGGKNTL